MKGSEVKRQSDIWRYLEELPRRVIEDMRREKEHMELCISQFCPVCSEIKREAT